MSTVFAGDPAPASNLPEELNTAKFDPKSSAFIVNPVPLESGGSMIGFVPVGTVEHRLSRLLGKVLTLMDACVADGRQNKACKDILRADFNSEINYLRSVNADPNMVEAYYKLQPTFD
jgi:hypothetical protein